MILTNKNFFCYTIISGGAKMSERDLHSRDLIVGSVNKEN